MPAPNALVPTYRQRQVVCARCRGVVCDRDDHVCHDQVRDPKMIRFLSALERVAQISAGDRARIQAAVASADPWDAVEIPEFTLVLDVAFLWVNLPASEQRVANAILEHAGVDLALLAA